MVLRLLRLSATKLTKSWASLCCCGCGLAVGLFSLFLIYPVAVKAHPIDEFYQSVAALFGRAEPLAEDALAG